MTINTGWVRPGLRRVMSKEQRYRSTYDDYHVKVRQCIRVRM